MASIWPCARLSWGRGDLLLQWEEDTICTCNIIYTILEFGVTTLMLLFPLQNHADSLLYLVACLLCSYLAKVIIDSKNNQPDLLGFEKQANKFHFLVRILIFIQGALILLQVASENSIPAFIGSLPILLLCLLF